MMGRRLQQDQNDLRTSISIREKDQGGMGHIIEKKKKKKSNYKTVGSQG